MSVSAELLLLAATTGAACLLAQAALTLLFARVLPDGVWRQQPAFAAHQVVALFVMVVMSVLGCLAWWAPESPHATPHERIYGPNPAGERLAAVMLGELVIWDIPLTLLPSIYSPAAMGHHVTTALIALLALRPYCAYYGARLPTQISARGPRCGPRSSARSPRALQATTLPPLRHGSALLCRRHRALVGAARRRRLLPPEALPAAGRGLAGARRAQRGGARAGRAAQDARRGARRGLARGPWG